VGPKGKNSSTGAEKMAKMRIQKNVGERMKVQVAQNNEIVTKDKRKEPGYQRCTHRQMLA
jgi:hypothetical protein